MKAGAEGWSFGYNYHLIEYSYGLSQGILRQRKQSLPPIKHLPRAGEKQSGGLGIETSFVLCP